VPKEIAPNYTTGRYWGGNPEQHRAGKIALGQELKNAPAFRQSLYPNAFGEGWGLYAEKLAKEMGLYQTPYEDFGRLTYD